MKFTKERISFKRLARFVLCLGLCAMLGTLSFAQVAFGKNASSTVTGLDSTPITGPEAYDIINVTGDDAVCVTDIDYTGYLNLNNGCEISALGAKQSNTIYGILLDGTGSNSVNITGSATILAQNNGGATGAKATGLEVNGLRVNSQDITIENIRAYDEAYGMNLLDAILNAEGNNLKINAVTSTNDYAFGVVAQSTQFYGVNNLEIVSVSGAAVAGGINTIGSNITVRGDLTIRDITATNDAGFALAIATFEGALTAGYKSDGNTPNPDATIQIEGDILSALGSEVPSDYCTKLALANKNPYIKGNFLGAEGNEANFLTLQDGGTWYPTFDTNASDNYVDVVFNSEGMINLNDKDWDGKSPREFFRTLNVYGNENVNTGDKFVANGGVFVINTNLAENKGDKINLNHADVSGTAKVQVAYDPFYETAQDKDIQKGNHTFLTVTNGAIKITAKETRWGKGNGKTLVFTPTVTNATGTQEASNEWKITLLTEGGGEPKEIVSETTKSVSDTAQAINTAWLETTNNLQKRLGDLRGGEASNTGWVRFQRNLDDLNNGRKLNVSGNLYQIGYDFALKNDTKNRSYLGLSLEHFDGTQSFNIGGGDIKSTTLGAYYTKIYDSGHYFDFIFRYGRYESDTTSYDASVDNPVSTKLDYAMNGFTLSGEYGYRAKLGKSGLYLEPQAEFIYGYLGGAKKTSSTGTLADIDSTNHFVSRLGLALGQRVKNFNYYLRTSYYHDFAGSTNITYGDASYKQDSAQNWWEVSLGGGWNVSDKSYFYAELTKHFKDVSNSLNFNLGFRFTL